MSEYEYDESLLTNKNLYRIASEKGAHGIDKTARLYNHFDSVKEELICPLPVKETHPYTVPFDLWPVQVQRPGSVAFFATSTYVSVDCPVPVVELRS